MIVTISGPVGIGKSALVTKLAETTGSILVPDLHSTEFRSLFFEDPPRWCFQYLSVHLARHLYRYRDVSPDQTFLFDQSIYEEILYIDTAYQVNVLSKSEHDVLTALYQSILPVLPQPELCLYLDVPKYRLIDRISGRSLERRLGPAYLPALDANYAEWAATSSLPIRRVPWTDFSAFNSVLDLLTHEFQPK
jgi:deoxyadenosine/deoxycytidine kinase